MDKSNGWQGKKRGRRNTKIYISQEQKELFRWPGRFPGIARNAGNHGNIKFHKSDQTLNQTKRDIDRFCLGKISLQKTVRMKFTVDSEFSNVFCGKKRKPGNARNQQKAF